MYLFKHFGVFCAFSASVALSSPFVNVVLESRGSSASWVKRERLDHDVLLPLRIALRQQNLDIGHERLMESSDPASLKYGEHWSSEQVAQFFAPSEQTINATAQWLSDFGLSAERLDLSGSRGFLTASVEVGELERLLETEYFTFDHSTDGYSTIACDKYHIPSHMVEHIDYITPGITLAPPSKANNGLSKRQAPAAAPCPPIPTATGSSTLEKCWLSANPECVTSLYHIPKDIKNHTGNELAIFALGTSYVPEDMELFFKHVATEIPVRTVPRNIFLNGGKLNQKYISGLNSEADLDFQVAWPLVYPYNLTLLDSPLTPKQQKKLLKSPKIGQYFLDGLNNMLEALDKSYCPASSGRDCGNIKVPQVISISYDGNETDVSQAAAKRMCNEFMKLSLQGTTVFTASADGGVAQRGNVCLGAKNQVFNPDLLAACPYVTAVGATQIHPHGTVHDPEQAAYQPQFNFSSSGGFSNYFTAPKWQADALEKFFCDSPPPYASYNFNGSLSSIGANGGRFNRQGRGFPDVSALGTNFTVVTDGCLNNSGGGTSAATPIWASIIWRINAERLAAGKTTLGFINPTLYANHQVFNDIVSGNNPGCGTNGFTAGEGWDPVTGLGTPNYPLLKDLFMSLR